MKRRWLVELSGMALVVSITMVAAWPAGAAGNLPEIPYLLSWMTSPHAKQDAEAFRHWDKEGAVPVTCAKCHSSGGFRDFVGTDGTEAGTVDNPAATDTVIGCVTCHNEQTLKLDEVEFPSGAYVEDAGRSMRCMLCHQGRQSTVQVHEATDGFEPDTVADKLKFLNVHYRAAAATLYGTVVKGAYEYAGQSYRGLNRHVKDLDTCIECHNVHSTAVKADKCALCHGDVENDLTAIRESEADFDGDGRVDEGLAHEIDTLHEILMKTIQVYAVSVTGKDIAYDSHAYPYFFFDTNGNGVADQDEATFPNQYKAWTPRLLKAAYNYQFVAKDPGAYAHNGRYVIQVLYDSIQDLGKKVKIDTANLQRP